MRGILVLAFVLGSLGLAVASMGHTGGGHNHGTAVVSHPWMW